MKELTIPPHSTTKISQRLKTITGQRLSINGGDFYFQGLESKHTHLGLKIYCVHETDTGLCQYKFLVQHLLGQAKLFEKHSLWRAFFMKVNTVK